MWVWFLHSSNLTISLDILHCQCGAFVSIPTVLHSCLTCYFAWRLCLLVPLVPGHITSSSPPRSWFCWLTFFLPVQENLFQVPWNFLHLLLLAKSRSLQSLSSIYSINQSINLSSAQNGIAKFYCWSDTKWTNHVRLLAVFESKSSNAHIKHSDRLSLYQQKKWNFPRENSINLLCP